MVNKQAWILRMEATTSTRGKVNETGTSESEQIVFEEGAYVDRKKKRENPKNTSRSKIKRL